MNTVTQFIVSQPTCRKMLLVILHWIADLLGITILPKGWMMFDPELAKALDNINSAIIFQKISGWVESNAKRNHNIIDGQAWSYNSYPDWARNEFVWLHPKTVGRHIRNLEKLNLLIGKQMNPDPLKREKWYSTLNSPDGNQLRLWTDEATPVVITNEGDVYNKKPTTSKPSIHKPSTPTTAQGRGRKASKAAGAVATFKTPSESGDLPEMQPAKAEGRPASNEGDYASAIEGTPDTADAPRPTPSSALPPSDLADLATFFSGCSGDELQDLLQQHGESRLRQVMRYAKDAKNVKNPPGLALALLAKDWQPTMMPPGFVPVLPPVIPPEPNLDTKPPSVPPVVSPDAETQPDMEDATPAPDSREMEAWRYLEICIGKPEFDTYLRGSKVRVDGATWTIRPVNGYAERMLQDHRFLNAIRRGLADVLIVAPEALNIQIERKAVAA